MEWAAEPNVFDKVPARHVRALPSEEEGADKVSEVSGSIKTEGLEESHKALAAWDYACYHASRVDKNWDGDSVGRALQCGDENAWLSVRRAADEAALTHGSSFWPTKRSCWTVLGLEVLSTDCTHDAGRRLDCKSDGPEVFRPFLEAPQASKRRYDGISSTTNHHHLEVLTVDDLDGCDMAGRQSAAGRGRRGRDLRRRGRRRAKDVLLHGDWYARLLAFTRCVVARRKHDAQDAARMRGPAGPRPK